MTTDSVLKEPSETCGHVFVLNCAAKGIAADAIFVHNGEVTDNPSRVASEKKNDKIQLYEAGSPANPDHLTPLFNSFLEQSAEQFQGERSSFRRGLPPLIAFDPTSFFGSEIDESTKMELLRHLVSKTYSIVDSFGVDLAVCVPDEESFVSVNSLRNEMCPFKGGPFWMLSDSQKANAQKLAGDAKVSRLSVFVGAGISMASGAPSWGALLELLAKKAGMSEDDRKSLSRLGYLDQPTVIAEDMGDQFKGAIAEIINESGRYTPAHVILKSLKAPAVTTNYDDLYEKAAESCNQSVPTLPWDARQMIDNARKEHNALLKLHGCVKHPESIILSRQDYMRYPDNCQALRGRLHGIFLTSEVLFCGFSMTDDNVHKIIDDARKVLYVDGKPTEHKLGTILSMTENKMFNRLWDQDFDLQSFGKSWSQNPSPAWNHDCFLDAIVADFIQE